MKKGKTSKIQGFKSAKVTYGTVDSMELKSIYLNIQTWVEPKKEVENWNRVVLNLSRAIKHIIYKSLDTNLFEQNFIVDLDLRSSGLILGKKSFSNLEVNLFVKDSSIDFKSFKLRDSLKSIVKEIFDQSFSKNEYFTCTLTKNDKKNNVQ
jgi:hypothetical protein